MGERRNEARNPREETERQAKKEGTGVGIDLSGQGSRVCSVFSARERERKKEGRKKRNRLFCSRRRGKKKNKCHNAVRSGSAAENVLGPANARGERSSH